MLRLAEALGKADAREANQTQFLPFVKSVWPGFIEGYHHKVIAKLFEDIAAGRKKRLIICLPPRHSKSEFASYLFPAWYMGQFPDKKIIQATHTAELSVNFGRKVRDLIGTKEYQSTFPGVALKSDTKAAGRWDTNAGGSYWAAGVGGALAGKGADIFIIDDPHPLHVDTPIPTTAGFKRMADVGVGDFVFSTDGKPVEVVAKSQVAHVPLYEVSASDGEKILCSGSHLWTVRNDAHADARLHTHDTKSIAEYSNRKGPFLPRHSRVEYPEADLLIDPYVLGAWLGDGSKSAGSMSSHPDDSAFMRAQFESAGYRTTDYATPYKFGVPGLVSHIRQLGLLNNKHVPDSYLTGSVKQRLALLQGLMDTDGSANKSGRCVFTNTNESIIIAVREILNSFGLFPAVRRRDGIFRFGAICRPQFVIVFTMAEAFRMPRKRSRARDPKQCKAGLRVRVRTISAKRTMESGPVQCLTVAGGSHLFLCGRSYIVTHNSEQDGMATDQKGFEKSWDWFTSGPRQRLQPNGSIIICATRWSKGDLIGRILKKASEEGDDEWDIVELPAILPSGKSLWPEFWPLEELVKIKRDLPPHKWRAQYLQEPTSGEGTIIKPEWWRRWPDKTPPKVSFVMQSWDTAFSAKSKSDYSAVTTWGIFTHPDERGRQGTNIVLLDAKKKRMEFPELKAMAKDEWKQWSPDLLIIEGRSSGKPLIQELRSMGIPVQDYSPTSGADKISRVNSIADLFASGVVWVPERQFASELIEEFSDFPAGIHDDLVDSATQALMRFRQGGFIQLSTDDDWNREEYEQPTARYY